MFSSTSLIRNHCAGPSLSSSSDASPGAEHREALQITLPRELQRDREPNPLLASPTSSAIGSEVAERHSVPPSSPLGQFRREMRKAVATKDARELLATFRAAEELSPTLGADMPEVLCMPCPCMHRLSLLLRLLLARPRSSDGDACRDTLS